MLNKNFILQSIKNVDFKGLIRDLARFFRFKNNADIVTIFTQLP